MKLSVLANLYGKKSLDETLKILSSLGVHTAEIGAGGFPRSCWLTRENSGNSSKPSKNTTWRSVRLPLTEIRCIPTPQKRKRMTGISGTPCFWRKSWGWIP